MKPNIEKELKDLQSLIDDVVDENVSLFTKEYFEGVETDFITGRNILFAPLQDYELEQALYYIENVLTILNPALEKDVESFVKLQIILKNMLG